MESAATRIAVAIQAAAANVDLEVLSLSTGAKAVSYARASAKYPRNHSGTRQPDKASEIIHRIDEAGELSMLGLGRMNIHITN